MRKNPQFFPGFIFTLTDLNPAEMMIYATIYGFTEKGGKGYTGTLEYLKDTIHENRPSAIRVLKSLMEKGYVVKTKTKGVRSPCYKAILPKKRAIEPEEVVTDEEIERELESLNESTEIILSNNEANVSKSNTESSIIEHSKVQKSNIESMKIEHIKEKEIKGEINNEIKKETLKKKEGEETGKKQGGKYLPGHDPLVAELYHAKYALYEELPAYDGKIAYIIENRSREVAESVVHEFLESLADGDRDKGPAHFDGFVFKKIGL